MCSIDLRKAFDKVNHCGLYIKLMERFVPTALLEVFENWLSLCYAFVKWYDSSSFVFSVCFGVQGSVLSPHLFAVYIDDVRKIFLPEQKHIYIVIRGLYFANNFFCHCIAKTPTCL